MTVIVTVTLVRSGTVVASETVSAVTVDAQDAVLDMGHFCARAALDKGWRCLTATEAARARCAATASRS